MSTMWRPYDEFYAMGLNEWYDFLIALYRFYTPLIGCRKSGNSFLLIVLYENEGKIHFFIKLFSIEDVLSIYFLYICHVIPTIVVGGDRAFKRSCLQLKSGKLK